MNRKITVKPDQSENYFTAAQALEDLGFIDTQRKIKYTRNRKEVIRDLFEKDEKLYAYLGMDHYNTTIYEIDLEVVDMGKEYEIV